LQEHPFADDVANSYNDGPPSPARRLVFRSRKFRIH